MSIALSEFRSISYWWGYWFCNQCVHCRRFAVYLMYQHLLSHWYLTRIICRCHLF